MTDGQKKIVLAYSGGLDTSVILHWLISQGHEVVTYTANLGQDEDMEEVVGKARQVGASATYVEDLRHEFVTDFIYPAIRANAIYEGRYLLGTSLARPATAKGQVQAARRRRDVVEIGRPARNVESRRFVGEFELPAHGATSSTRDSPEESSRKQRRSMCRAAVMR